MGVGFAFLLMAVGVGRGLLRAAATGNDQQRHREQ
jgi:hypothetical protein